MFRKSILWALLGLLAMALGFLTAVYSKLYLDSFFNRAQVEVPDLTGQSSTSVKRFISTFSGRLKVKTHREVTSRTVPRDHVVSQDPLPGSHVPQGKYILLTVSSGMKAQDVPKVVGHRLRQARLILSQSFLKVGQLSYMRQPAVEEGLVMGQFPEAGDRAGRGETIDLLLSAGGASGRVMMPRVTYLALSEAREILQGVGVTELGLQERTSPGSPATMVIAQYPPPGRILKPDDKVQLDISRGLGMPTPQGRDLWISFDMPPGMTRKTLTVLVTDDGGTRQVYQGPHEPGERVNLKVNGKGSIKVEYYLDDDPLPVRENLY